MSDDRIRTIKTYGGKQVQVEDGFAIFGWNGEDWVFIDFAGSIPDQARHECDRAVMEQGFEAAYFAPAVMKVRP